jgi:carbon monoxide dehydrogenase subunit G
MKLTHAFDVDAPVEQVWSTLTELERVAPCLPGAEITGADGSGTYQGTFNIKLGPATAVYQGGLRMELEDKVAHTTVIDADGQDKRGQGGAKARITTKLSQAPATTHVEVVTDLTITGRMARFGRGSLVQDVSNRLMAEFSRNLRDMIETSAPAAHIGDRESDQAEASPAPPPARPVKALPLLWASLMTRLRRRFGRREA